MPGAFRAAVNKAIPWLLFGSVMLPALLSAVAGILVLAFWRRGGDIALGVLVIVMAMTVIAGSFISLGLLRRQNRMARAQAEFIAHVSHELRTPMASIMMGVETLRSGRVADDQERRGFLDMLDRESRRLAGLVEQAIGYQVAAGQRIAARAGQAAQNPPPVLCASRLLRQAVAGYVARPGTVKALVVRTPHDSGPTGDGNDNPGDVSKNGCFDLIAVDPDGFTGAVCNLINNALTHGGCGPDSPVEVSVLAHPAGEWTGDGNISAPHGVVVIEVTDHGPGIHDDEHKIVFEKFRRGSGTGETTFPGFGLGLSIVREFALAHGGAATVESAPGEGCTFRIVLPNKYVGDHA